MLSFQGHLAPEKISYWCKKQEEKLELWPTNWVAAGAIENTIGVFTYILEGKEKAIDYFTYLLRKQGRSKVNTLANLIFLHTEETDTGKEFKRELEVIQDSDSLSNKLDVSRGICEQGYFCGFYISEERHIPKLMQDSFDLLKAGVESGERCGMSPNELCVWQSFQFIAAKDVFANCGIQEGDEFGNAMTTFSQFYSDIEDEMNYYKSISLMEVATMFIKQHDKIETHPEFTKFCKHNKT